MKTQSLKISVKNVYNLREVLALKVGQILRAKVLAVSGREVILGTGTATLKAETKVPLKKGENLRLYVEAASKDFIKLKVLAEGETVKPETAALLRLGMKPQPELERITSHFLKFRLPVQKEGLAGVNNILKGFGLSKEFLPVLAWLKSAGVEVTSREDVEILRELVKLFRGETGGKTERILSQFLNRTENIYLGGYNIYSWPLEEHRLFLVTRDSKGERIDPAGTTLIIRVESKAFGPLWFRINYLEGRLNVLIACNKERLKEIIRKESFLLEEALSRAGYNPGDIRVELREVDTIFDLFPEEFREIKGIDYKI